MKQKTIHILLTILMLATCLKGEAQTVNHLDSMEISLLTCSPGKEIWAQYGHTALRIRNLANGQDLTVNYGIFSSSQPYFALRFLFGLTDYHVGVSYTELFLSEYAREGRGITEQKLNLSSTDKQAIYKALQHNLKPENVIYRYNFFYDNCTSRARDLITNNLHGKLSFPKDNKRVSFRSMIHQWNFVNKWSQLGEDLLLGVKADCPTTQSEQQFLPVNLMNDLSNTIYRGKSIVSETNQLLEPHSTLENDSSIFNPILVGVLFAILSTIIIIMEYKKLRIFWFWDASLLLLSGLIGIILFLMIFSQHPCVSLNINILFFNPLCLVFFYPVIKNARRGESHRWWSIWQISIILGFIGTLFQRVPIPILIVASFLLINCMIHRFIFIKQRPKIHE